MSQTPDRVLIVDVSHIAYTHSRASRQLYCNHPDYGPTNTTVQTGIIKNIFRWSSGGEYPTLVAFDESCPSRKAFVQETLNSTYKEGRTKNYALYAALKSARGILSEGGVSAMGVPGYEADDVVAAAVHSAKQLYPTSYIDVITGDTDLVPLVDEQVSVYLRSVKGTKFTTGPRREKYAQVTPETYEEIIGSRSAFKTIETPFNTLILAKILRGDSSDALVSPVKSKFRPKQYNALLDDMRAQGIERLTYTRHSYNELFQYLQGTGLLTDEELWAVSNLWKAMCLNYPYEGSADEPGRPSLPNFRFGGFDRNLLQDACSPYSIHLPS